MIISENVKKLMISQVTREFESSHMYLGFANWCENKSLFGFAAFFYSQAKGERKHAQRFIDYLNDKNCFYTPETINVIYTDFENKATVDFIIASLAQENKVTELIYALCDAAIQDKDYMSREFLNWFLAEQREEEKLTADILARCKIVGKDSAGFLDIDRELSEKYGKD